MAIVSDYQKYLAKAAETEQKYGIPKDLLVGLLRTESAFDPDIISGKRVSSAGAVGIAQFMPGTSKEMGINPREPMQSIDAAGRYLSQQYKATSNWDQALMAYNMGLGNLRKWQKNGGKLNKETSEYVSKVRGTFKKGEAQRYLPKNNETSYAQTEQQRADVYQEPTIDLTNLDSSFGSSTFVAPIAGEEKEVDEDVKQLEQVTQERNFLKEYQEAQRQTVQAPIQQEQQQPQYGEPINLEGIFNNVSQFVDAQQGGKFELKDERLQGTTQRDNTRVNLGRAFDIKNKNLRNKTDQEIAEERRLRILETEKANKNQKLVGNKDWRKVLANQTATTGDSMRVSLEPNFFDDYLNPAVMVGDMAASLGSAPLRAEQEDSYLPYVTAVGAPLLTGALGGIGANSNRQFVNNLVNPLAGVKTNITPELREGLKTNSLIGDIFKKNKGVSEDIDFMNLDAHKGNLYGEHQVVTQQNRLLNPKIKEKFFQHQKSEQTVGESMFSKRPSDAGNRITPENYEDFINDIHSTTEYTTAATHNSNPWNLGIGKYGKQGVVFSDAPLDGLGKDIINAHEKNHGVFAGTLSDNVKKELMQPFGGVGKKAVPNYKDAHQADEVLARMGQFKNAIGIGDNQTFTKGHLDLIRERYTQNFTDNSITEMLEKIKVGSLEEKTFLKNMNKFAFSSAAVVGANQLTEQQGGKITDNERLFLKAMQSGGIIDDNQGQWTNPGEITRISSGDITMKGVNYPVLGIDNLGNKKMMQPNKEYQFEGTSVTEYPQLTENEKQFLKEISKQNG